MSIFWVIGPPLIWGFIAKSVLWPLRFLKLRGLNYPHERPLPAKGEGCTIWLNEENGFGLNWGQRSSVKPKIISTSQNYLVCKISRFFVHWGQFYGTFCKRLLTLLYPFSYMIVYAVDVHKNCFFFVLCFVNFIFLLLNIVTFTYDIFYIVLILQIVKWCNLLWKIYLNDFLCHVNF